MPPFGSPLKLRACHLACSSSVSRHGRLLCPLMPLHFVQPQHVHRLPLFCSPAGRIGLRLDFVCIAAAPLWRRIRKALCSALRAVIVFAKKSKNLRQPFTSTELQAALSGSPLQPPCSTRSAARDACLLPITLRSTVSSQPFGSRLFFLRLRSYSPQLNGHNTITGKLKRFVFAFRAG